MKTLNSYHWINFVINEIIIAKSNAKVNRDLVLEKVSKNAGSSAPKSQLSRKTKSRRQKGKNWAKIGLQFLLIISKCKTDLKMQNSEHWYVPTYTWPTARPKLGIYVFGYQKRRMCATIYRSRNHTNEKLPCMRQKPKTPRIGKDLHQYFEHSAS